MFIPSEWARLVLYIVRYSHIFLGDTTVNFCFCASRSRPIEMSLKIEPCRSFHRIEED
jgi:hypothetical protein